MSITYVYIHVYYLCLYICRPHACLCARLYAHLYACPHTRYTHVPHIAPRLIKRDDIGIKYAVAIKVRILIIVRAYQLSSVYELKYLLGTPEADG